MTILGQVSVQALWDGRKFDKGMEKSQKRSKRTQATFKKLKAGFAALGAAAVAGGAAFLSFVGKVTEANRELTVVSRSIDVTAGNWLRWSEAAKQTGVSTDALADAFRELQRRTAEAALDKSGSAYDAFKKIRLNAKQLLDLNIEQRFEKVVKAIERVDDAAKRNFLFDEIFGGAMDELGGSVSDLIALSKELDKSKFNQQAATMGEVAGEWKKITADLRKHGQGLLITVGPDVVWVLKELRVRMEALGIAHRRTMDDHNARVGWWTNMIHRTFSPPSDFRNYNAPQPQQTQTQNRQPVTIMAGDSGDF